MRGWARDTDPAGRAGRTRYHPGANGGASFAALQTVDPAPAKTGIVCTGGINCSSGRELGDFQSLAMDLNGRANMSWNPTASSATARACDVRQEPTRELIPRVHRGPGRTSSSGATPRAAHHATAPAVPRNDPTVGCANRQDAWRSGLTALSPWALNGRLAPTFRRVAGVDVLPNRTDRDSRWPQ